MPRRVATLLVLSALVLAPVHSEGASCARRIARAARQTAGVAFVVGALGVGALGFRQMRQEDEFRTVSAERRAELQALDGSELGEKSAVRVDHFDWSVYFLKEGKLLGMGKYGGIHSQHPDEKLLFASVQKYKSALLTRTTTGELRLSGSFVWPPPIATGIRQVLAVGNDLLAVTYDDRLLVLTVTGDLKIVWTATRSGLVSYDTESTVTDSNQQPLVLTDLGVQNVRNVDLDDQKRLRVNFFDRPSTLLSELR